MGPGALAAILAARQQIIQCHRSGNKRINTYASPRPALCPGNINYALETAVVAIIQLLTFTIFEISRTKSIYALGGMASGSQSQRHLKLEPAREIL